MARLGRQHKVFSCYDFSPCFGIGIFLMVFFQGLLSSRSAAGEPPAGASLNEYLSSGRYEEFFEELVKTDVETGLGTIASATWSQRSTEPRLCAGRLLPVGSTPLMCLTLLSTTNSAYYEAYRAALLQHKTHINDQNSNGETAVFLAGLHAGGEGGVATLRLLLTLRPDLSLANSKGGYTPLMAAVRFAATKSSLDAVGMLLDAGSEVNRQNHEGWTALMLAARYAGSESVVGAVSMLLSKQAKLELRHNDGWTALNIAARYAGRGSDMQATALLLAAGADLNTQNRWGLTPLMVASMFANNDEGRAVVRLLLDHHARFGIQAEDGQSAVRLAFANSEEVWPAYAAHFASHPHRLIEAFTGEVFARTVDEDVVSFAIEQLEEAFGRNQLGEHELDALYHLAARHPALGAWFGIEKMQAYNALINRDRYLRKLQAFASQELHRQLPGAEESPSEANEECSLCCGAMADEAAAARAARVCKACVSKWFAADGALAGVGIELSKAELLARGDRVSASDLYVMGVDHATVRELEIEKLRGVLKRIPGWQFCPTPGCFNGKVVGQTPTDLYLHCGLCGEGACVGCGRDHHGNCTDDERTRDEVKRLAELGRKAPRPGDADCLNGKFRPCYYCGVLSERLDGCSSMRCGICQKEWDFNWGDPARNPRFNYDFSAEEQQYEPLVDAHF